MNSETQLNSLPGYQHYVIGHNVTKEQNGFRLDSTYYKKYYSTIDAEVYFGDEYVEDAHDIQWQIIQQTQPLFGYNSYVFDEIAKGNRIIQGSFSINFRGANYFDILLSKAKITDTYTKTYTIGGTSSNPQDDEEKGKIIDESDKKPLWDVRFDIDVICMNDARGGGPAHLVLQDTAISTCGQAVAASGGVMQQHYTFIARDILTVE